MSKITVFISIFLMVLFTMWVVCAKIYPNLPVQPAYQPSLSPVEVKPDALTFPLAGIYKIIDEKPVKVGELKDNYFPCIILKHIVLTDEKFVLIKIEQVGLSEDILMVRENSVVVLNEKVQHER